MNTLVVVVVIQHNEVHTFFSTTFSHFTHHFFRFRNVFSKGKGERASTAVSDSNCHRKLLGLLRTSTNHRVVEQNTAVIRCYKTEAFLS